MMRARHAALAAACAVVLIAAVAIGVTRALPPSGRSMDASGVAAIGGPFTLIDDTGAPVTDAALKGKPTVVDFGYTYCPDVCPTTLSDLTRWIANLGPDADRLNYVFVTVDPRRDTPKVLHEYLSAFDKRIRGFTGTPEQIAKIAAEYKVYYKKAPTKGGGYLVDHSAMLYLMGSDEQFVGLLAYQEKDASAVAKLKSLAQGQHDFD